MSEDIQEMRRQMAAMQERLGMYDGRRFVEKPELVDYVKTNLDGSKVNVRLNVKNASSVAFAKKNGWTKKPGPKTNLEG
jgi:hypothetical protein